METKCLDLQAWP